MTKDFSVVYGKMITAENNECEERETERERERERDRQTDKQTDRQRYRQADRESGALVRRRRVIA